MQQKNLSTPERSLSAKVILLMAVLLPPVGLVMLWMKRDTDTDKKLLGSVGIVALAAVYVFVLAQTGILSKLLLSGPDNEAHYSELEKHRARQKEEAAAAGGATEQQPTDTAATAAVPTAGTAATPAAAGAAAPTVAPRLVWANYRGANRDGRYDEKPINTSWSNAGLTPAWKQPVGAGWASFVIADGVAFTIEQRRQQEVAAAYDLKTGRELWTQGWNAEFKESMGGDGPRATPTWDEGKLYALGATGELRCLDAKSGRVIWGKNILNDNGATNLQWGMAAAPLIVDDKVIVQPGGKSGKSVVAYNKNTGAAVWRSLNDTQSYVSPMLVTLAGRRQILTVTANRIVGLEPENGALLWDYTWDTSMGINCSQPIPVDANRFFVSSGYGKGAALVEVRDNGGSLAASKVWENVFMKNKFNSSVLHNGYVYGLDDPGILTCIDVATGERKWKSGRFGLGQLILASDHLIVISEEGELALIRATPDSFQEVAKFKVLEGRTWNNPAIADGRLLIRNGTEMACFNLTAQ